MNRQKTKKTSFTIGIVSSIGAFVALTFLTGGFVEVSQDVGLLSRISEMTVYAVSNKLTEKLIASVAIGGASSFVAHMIAYGKTVKARGSKTTHVQFNQGDSGATRTA